MIECSPKLFVSPPDPRCRVTVILPAKDEQSLLPSAIRALAGQRDGAGRALAPSSYEVLVLLNNCSDESLGAVRAASAAHSHLRLQVEECTLPPERAHAGTARRLLMDAAALRLAAGGRQRGVIISTDADTEVAADWIHQNCVALDQGADAVGGLIELGAEERRHMGRTDTELLLAYERDRRYQALVAWLESSVDPDPYDPWPRHLDHFGASLACTAAIYEQAGGIPAVTPLEDVAFVQALRRVGARIRHAPAVRVTTSARLDGRASVGLSWQLRQWKLAGTSGRDHRVLSAEFLLHRFRTVAALRRLHAGMGRLPEAVAHASGLSPAAWTDLLEQELPFARFLDEVDAGRIVEQGFSGSLEMREGEITAVLAELEQRFSGRVQGHRAETAPPAWSAPAATLAG